MRTTFLLPNYWKWIGWLLFISPIFTQILLWHYNVETYDFLKYKIIAFYNEGFIFDKTGFFETTENSLLDELLLTICLIGGIITGFYKTKFEDEMVLKIRYESMAWSLIVNTLLIILTTWMFYGNIYFNVMIVYIVLFLLIYNIRLHYQLYLLQKISENDE